MEFSSIVCSLFACLFGRHSCPALLQCSNNARSKFQAISRCKVARVPSFERAVQYRIQHHRSKCPAQLVERWAVRVSDISMHEQLGWKRLNDAKEKSKERYLTVLHVATWSRLSFESILNDKERAEEVFSKVGWADCRQVFLL